MISTIFSALCLTLSGGLAHEKASLSHASIAPREAIVVSIKRYKGKHGKVYEDGPNHLYYLNKNGTGLRQLTFGKQEDLWPVASLDKKHVLFWRHPLDQDDVFVLYSVGLNGKGLRRMWKSDGGGDGFALSFERFGLDPIREKPIPGASSPQYYDAKGRIVPPNYDLYYAPDGLHAVGVPFDDKDEAEDEAPDGPQATQVGIYTFKTGDLKRISPDIESAIWIDGHTLLGQVKGHPHTLVLFDEKGKELMRKAFGSDGLGEGGEDVDSDIWEPPLKTDAFPFGPRGRFLIKGHHDMSDGGYDYTVIVDMIHGKSKALREDVQAVSANGSQFLAAAYKWVGGYKRPGAAKLCKLYLTDSKTFKRKSIGLPFMTVDGACFVPSSAP